MNVNELIGKAATNYFVTKVYEKNRICNSDLRLFSYVGKNNRFFKGSLSFSVNKKTPEEEI
jgi:hypothetical protein